MVATGTGHRVLLRAEVGHGGRTTVTHTLGLDAASTFVPLDDPPPVGSPVSVRLSFPRLVEPVALAAVVTAHHASSGPGDPGGATIEFTFPSEHERTQLQALLARLGRAGPAVDARPVGYRVLLVDDNQMICDMFAYGVRKYFRQHSSSVTVDLANDGAQAWSRLLSGSYDLAIIDYYLPVLGGGELIARMRREPRFAGIPVVAISVGGPEARDASLAAGADLFLPKPLVLRDLFATLERLTVEGGAP
ncbi:MAG: response regulator [Deltaproteobacteria bacterium]|nr:response regulator [Deltaproteobacteria bacterium]